MREHKRMRIAAVNPPATPLACYLASNAVCVRAPVCLFAQPRRSAPSMSAAR
jgi:hypothetical protein